ncbi:c-type cytochrome [Chelativorans sp. YIM 93263]|uniref:c-type cytochrome n=1 Tax=Chelativorans sp. YIM 93263 TaxID=2906648 RepID=UPI00237909F7|nr:cytochrome c family protein [Chelativorans sp. YIM 93263]
MDSFELNKIIGALLAVIFVIFSVNLVSHAVFSSPAPETPGYAIEVPEDDGTGEADAEEEPELILPLLASADASAGESVFRRCQACHSVGEGEPNKVGPNLWDIVNAPIASDESFGYSGAIVDFSEGGEVTWTYENLDHFLADPRGFIPGTAMAFAGLANIEDRANVIAYLRSMSDDPAPLPEAGAEEGEAAADEDDSAASEEGDEAASDDAAADGDAGQAAGDDAADTGIGDGGADAADDAVEPLDGSVDESGGGGEGAAGGETGDSGAAAGEGDTAEEEPAGVEQ